MLKNDEINLLSSNLPFWNKLNNDEKQLLITHSKSSHFDKNQSVYCGETECIGLLIVKNGTIRTYITSEEGREVTLYRLNPGDICVFSASCVLNSITFDVSIDADTDCDVIEISSVAFSRLSSNNVYVELFGYKLAAERFSEVMWTMQQILFTSFDKRLAAFLLNECRKNDSGSIKMTHEQLAKYLGTAREVVSRMLKYFSTEGYISLSRGTIKIIDKEKLKSIL